MVWALSTVFVMIQDCAWEPGGRIDPPTPAPFDAFRPDRLKLVCPFAIVRTRLTPSRRRRIRAA